MGRGIPREAAELVGEEGEVAQLRGSGGELRRVEGEGLVGVGPAQSPPNPLRFVLGQTQQRRPRSRLEL